MKSAHDLVVQAKTRVSEISADAAEQAMRDADVVVYLEAGQIKAVGTFDEVRSSVPNFDKQAKLMGL